MNEKKLLKWALAGGIIIVLNLFFNYGLSVFYPSPEWGDFCNEMPTKDISTEEMCTDEGGKWTASGEYPRPVVLEGERSGYCDTSFYCREAYEDARDVHSRNAFIALLLLGVASLLLGILLSIPAVVSLGLSYGGALSLVIASMRYWGSADDIIRLLILAIALAILIFVGIRKFSD
ncbi:MAG: hypothetical protein WDZ70_02260 [Candidatus Paceibacterota bacterium]